MFGLPYNFGPITGPYFPPIVECDNLVVPKATFHPYGGARMPNAFSSDCKGIPQPGETIFDLHSHPIVTRSAKNTYNDYTVVMYDDFEEQVLSAELLTCGLPHINLTGNCKQQTIADVRIAYRIDDGRFIVKFIGGRRDQTTLFKFRLELVTGRFVLYDIHITVWPD